MARFIEFSRMLENGTEWLHVTGTEPPSGINFDNEYFSQYATEDVIREELHPKTIGKRTENVPGAMKKEMEGRLWRQYWDAPGNIGTWC
jgi:hypothetical protein